MYTRLVVDPDGYTDSATKATRAVAQLETAGQHALKSLSGLAHMGGDDEAGGKFAHAYDKQAIGIFDGLGALCSALSQTAAALGASAVSHANAEAANAGPNAVPPVVPDPPVAVVVSFAHPKSAYGGTNIFPQGWTFIQDLVSATWPDGDTGKMRHGKAAWNALADDIDDVVSQDISTLLDPLQGFQAPDISAITRATSVLKPAAKELSRACRDLAHACGEYADAVDQAHEDAGRELFEFIATTIAAIGISAILTPFTAGISDLVGGAAVAADAAITAGEVSETLGVLVARVAPLLVKLGDASRSASALTSFSAKSAIFLGRTAGVGSVWSVASVTGDYMVNGSDATPGEDVVYSLVAGGFAEGGKVFGEAASAAAKDTMTGAARAAAKIASEEAPEVLGKPAIDGAVLDGPKHAAPPVPVSVKVTSAGIKATSYLGGTAIGSVVGQTITTGMDPERLPGDIGKDGAEGLVPILERGPKHITLPVK